MLFFLYLTLLKVEFYGSTKSRLKPDDIGLMKTTFLKCSQIMANIKKQNMLGLSESELSVYLALFKNNPINGSQLSKASGIPRTRIYDILHAIKQKGMVIEPTNGQFVPLPPGEFVKRMRTRYEAELGQFEEMVQDSMEEETFDYFWTISGYAEVMAKAKEIITMAKKNLSVLLFPEEARELDSYLKKAEKRGVQVKYVSIGTPQTEFKLQVVHPYSSEIMARHKGRVFDLVKDKDEVLVGMFKKREEDKSSINWVRNHWYVTAVWEAIRHDFFHCFLEKIVDQGLELSEKELEMYEIVKQEPWS